MENAPRQIRLDQVPEVVILPDRSHVIDLRSPEAQATISRQLAARKAGIQSALLGGLVEKLDELGLRATDIDLTEN